MLSTQGQFFIICDLVTTSKREFGAFLIQDCQVDRSGMRGPLLARCQANLVCLTPLHQQPLELTACYDRDDLFHHTMVFIRHWMLTA